jgi:CDP-glucose 4,6-dehydratase
LTGHTGFKGAWLSLWLQKLGAEVYGLALAPHTTPNLFDLAGVGQGMRHRMGDICDQETVSRTVAEAQAEVVIHMAAQSLVRESYAAPVLTFATNVMGTAHVLDACREAGSARAIVVVTSDKCYENREWVHPYREADPLGGHDPYAASKAGAEIVTSSYRSSFFGNGSACVASVRAGNVIGGGDWSTDRLVPDCIRSFVKGEPVRIRNPHSVRPWLYVLEPLAGYLMLAQRLIENRTQPDCSYGSSFNFAPDSLADAPVSVVAERLATLWGDGAVVVVAPSNDALHEANLLRLDATKARMLLGWRPRLGLHESLEALVGWYRAWNRGEDMRSVSLQQIDSYEERLAA